MRDERLLSMRSTGAERLLSMRSTSAERLLPMRSTSAERLLPMRSTSALEVSEMLVGGGSCSCGKRVREGKWRCVDGMARACFTICLLHESGESLLHDLLAS